jgi:hypothetical protein
MSNQSSIIKTGTEIKDIKVQQNNDPDYLGVFCLCSTVLLLGLLFICVLNFWIKKFYKHKLTIDAMKLDLEQANYKNMSNKLDNMIELQKEINENIKNGI